MGSKSRKHKNKKRRAFPMVVAVLSAAVVTLVVFLLAYPETDLHRLEGKWFRADGGYVIEIRSVTDDGRLEAGYYNPNPIHVSRAEATEEQDHVKVFIELKDVNYPGSTYTLRYDKERDVLEGVYYQAALKQNFNVRFIRMD